MYVSAVYVMEAEGLRKRALKGQQLEVHSHQERNTSQVLLLMVSFNLDFLGQNYVETCL